MKDLEHILQCPLTQAPLVLLDASELVRLNARIDAREAVFINGQPVAHAVRTAFQSQGGTFVYIVENGILCLLPSMAIVQNPDNLQAARAAFRWNAEKQNVQDFYQQIGWQKGEDDLFEDTLQFEETRPVAQEYISRCHRRLKRFIPAEGRYLLDVASGPLQFPEYLEYSSQYEKRICVDLSAEALKSAQKQLGERGLYILGDITSLPLQNNVVDGAISLHTIYHVPQAEQADAFRQLHRVLKPGGKAAVVYTWGKYSELMAVLLFPAKLIAKGPRKLWALLKSLAAPLLPAAKEEANAAAALVLYYHPHSYGWFTRQDWPFQHHIHSWRSVSLDFLQAYIHEPLFGRRILRAIYALEERFPRWLGRHGQYPVIVITK